MCKHCNNTNKKDPYYPNGVPIYFDTINDAYIRHNSNILVFRLENNMGGEIRITYCPMCNNKLNKEV